MALVTGASRGIGKAFAESLPPHTSLLLVGRDQERLGTLATRLGRPERSMHVVVADLATDEGRGEVIERAEALGIDLLINNAGTGQLGPLIDHPPEQERATVELNVVAPVVLISALLPGMLARARAEGRPAGLIIVASEAAFAPLPYFATYAASKAFDLVLAESLAVELRDEPVDVLALCPGATRTEFGRRAGFAGGNLPGAADPQSVARQALAALGRQTVLVPGLGRQAVFAPLTLPRALAARGFGTAISLLMRWQARRGEQG